METLRVACVRVSGVVDIEGLGGWAWDEIWAVGALWLVGGVVVDETTDGTEGCRVELDCLLGNV